MNDLKGYCIGSIEGRIGIVMFQEGTKKK